MSLTRRSLLTGMLCTTVSPLPFARMALAAGFARPVVVLIGGAGWTTNSSDLRNGLSRLLESEVPVAIAINPLQDDGSPIGATEAIAVTLRDLAERYHRLIEVCVDLGMVMADAPLEQLRRASTAQTALVGLMNVDVENALRPPITASTAVTTTPPASTQDFRTMRAAGIRTVLHLPHDEASEDYPSLVEGYQTTSSGLASLVAAGGERSIIDRAGELDMPALTSIIDEPGGSAPRIVPVDIGAFSTPAGLYSIGTLAGILRGATENGVIRTLLPSTVYAQRHPDDIRRVVLRFDGLVPEGGDVADVFDGSIMAALTQAFPADGSSTPRDRSLDLALLDRDDDRTASTAAFDRIVAGARQAFEATGYSPSTLIPRDIGNGAMLDAAANAGIPAVSAPIGSRDPTRGMDDAGVLHLPDTVGFRRRGGEGLRLPISEVLSQLSSTNDAVLAIDPDAVSTPEGLRDLKVVLSAVSDQRGTTISGCRAYYNAVTPGLGWVRKIQQAKAEVRVLDADDGSPDDGARSRLLEDARLAWTFFEWGATRFTGMVPGTASRQNGANSVGWPYATQWDIGSYLNAALAAHFLGLIDQQTFDKSVSDTLALLPRAVFSYAGARLPNTEIGLGSNTTTARGYDSHDTGRLLIALGNLDTYAPERFPVADVVASWELGAGIVDGLIYSIAGNGTFIEGHYNSYAHYIRNGFVRWGYDPLPVYPDFPAGIEGEVALVKEVARRGRVATEALVTEEVEVGATSEIGLISDVLLAAQIQRHRETGVLTCTSEGPLDFPPYFSYQGYQITEGDGEFVVDGRTDEQQTLLRGMGTRARMVSTKGCFLWHAARPGAYSTALYEHARETARIEGLGFSSGIHEGTNHALAVSDVNTNGLILEAIAYIFNGRKPLSELTRQT